MENKEVITRFAPSPTGEMHIGNVRTALFEYLTAKGQGGKFLMRIEDTDRERFVEGSSERIIESLKWLGIYPENLDNLIVQSQRLEIYREAAFKLVEEGKAYICTCSKEKLEAERKKQEAEKRPTGYAGTCRELNISPDEVKEGEYVIRMKMPKEGKVVVPDLIRGDVEFDLALSDDQVILKSDGFPTYHLAAIIDDHEMGITDVIRGEEWLSSTPKHLILYQMFGWEPPRFGHLPLILATDRTKLSKRHGAVSLTEYRNLGYLPEAIVNFLALLGWNPGDEREYFTLAELEKAFSIARVQKSPAIFNIDKLNNINEHYIQSKISEILSQNDEEKIGNFLSDFGVAGLKSGELELLGRGGYKTLREAADYILKLRLAPEYPAEMLVFKKSTKEATLKALKEVESRIRNNESWDSPSLQDTLASVVAENGLTNGDVFWPARVALSGEEKSPSPVELMIALGKEESLSRLEKAFEKLI
jgi:glutamyl-tRNA synthetase